MYRFKYRLSNSDALAPEQRKDLCCSEVHSVIKMANAKSDQGGYFFYFIPSGNGSDDDDDEDSDEEGSIMSDGAKDAPKSPTPPGPSGGGQVAT